MSERGSILSTSEVRQPLVAASAMRSFARGGYHGTTVAEVARESGISPAYVFKLFPGKDQLFIAALENCFAQVETCLAEGADASDDQSPTGVLDAMGEAYAALIADKTLLMLQVHAQSVAEISEIGAGLRNGIARVTRFAKSRSGASDDEVQRFIAYGQLCHLIVTTHIDGADADWARLLTRGIRHPSAA